MEEIQKIISDIFEIRGLLRIHIIRKNNNYLNIVFSDLKDIVNVKIDVTTMKIIDFHVLT